MNSLLGSGYSATPEGEWVNTKHLMVSTILAEYSATPGAPQLRLAHILPKDRETAEDHSHPFAVIQKFPDGTSTVIFTLREDEVDERVIARVWSGDPRNSPLAKMEEAKKAMDLRTQMYNEELIAEAKEFSKSVLKSNKHSFKHNGIRYD